ncbi:uncharacterized protein STEHIDRAFT_78332 [Stereum hirsutum FP-91666 SS1]|uniref:uncharacterized protein n=1 Tax=Stereum hirsutum (strain FP-91666) TaxID=721885 RepID=UPI000440DC21|nr:uncharacterized protein STEHIDRAFT_78332 [Stereum hirsutum FP-91666 SS1]EIM87421.1 hypothetical protein STEHIDRAFT_78332 [Stereum hirsutum FP-91666 SS1]
MIQTSEKPSTSAAAGASSEPGKPYVRLARPEDYPQIEKMARRAFINDPMPMYLAANPSPITAEDRKADDVESLFHFLIGIGRYFGGRTTVVAIPTANPSATDGAATEKIAAMCLWMPPKCRANPWSTVKLFKSGIWRPLKAWGPRMIKRLAFEFEDIANTKFGSIFKEKGNGQKPDDAWYLQVVCTDPDEQGKGFLSMLIREGFAHAPNANLYLEASTPKARDRYAHLGFQLETPARIGKGRADSLGYKAKGEKATGFDVYLMVKWGPS